MNKIILKPGLQVAFALGLPLVLAETEKKTIKTDEAKSGNITVKPSQLPLYEEPEDLNIYEYYGREKTSLEQGVGVLRREIVSAGDMTKEIRDYVTNFYETGKSHSLSTIDYLHDNENTLARAGAITAGGLIGIILAARRGFLKKLVYGATGAGGAACVCYPKEAYEFTQDIAVNASDYATIGYNFIVGVKPQFKETADDVKQVLEKARETSQTSASSSTSAPQVHEVPKFPLTSEKRDDKSKQGIKDKKDLVVQLEQAVKKTIEGDIGQGNPDDKDMYTTRSS